MGSSRSYGATSVRARACALAAGGLRPNTAAAERATAAGTETVIASGFEPGVLARAAAGEPAGPRCLARPLGMSSFKLWLKFAKPSHGLVRVDAAAARALREGGTSLLPVGITEVEGSFDAGDAVDVVHNGGRIGKGISNYS